MRYYLGLEILTQPHQLLIILLPPNYIQVDNNTPPSIILTEIEEEVSDTVQIEFILSDNTDDTLRLESFFSIDNGENWIASNIVEPMVDISSMVTLELSCGVLKHKLKALIFPMDFFSK